MVAPKNAKVVHLTSVHRPYDHRIFHKECKTLAEAGYETMLVVPHEGEELRDGRIRIRTVPKPRSRRLRMTRTVWDVYRAAVEEDAQVYHIHDPELIPVGMLLKLRGKKVVYDVHEDLPRQIVSKDWIPRRLRPMIANIAEAVETMAARAFDGIVSATPAIAKRFPHAETVIVQNFPILDKLTFVEPRPYAERPNVVAYVGSITAIRGIKEMVQSMALIPGTLDAKLLLGGIFDPVELENEIKQLRGWERTDNLGWQSREGVAQLLAIARVGLVLLHPRPNYLESYPVKLFEYMSMGIPVVVSDFPLWRVIVGEAGCALFVNPLDVDAIAKAVQWLLENPREAEQMGQRGRDMVVKKYNWSSEARKLISLYRRMEVW